MSIHIGLTGITGRLNGLIAELLLKNEYSGCVLRRAFIRPGHENSGKDIGCILGLAGTGINTDTDLEAVFNHSDVVIDFTVPETLPDNLDTALKSKIPMVIGTTGFDKTQFKLIDNAALEIPVLYASNTSMGVSVLYNLVEKAAAILGPDWDIEISETHHRYKKDAPSGTALALGKAAATGRDINLEDNADFDRIGKTAERQNGRIGFAVQRGGDVPGEHTVSFFGPSERIELTHSAHDRTLFARGAIQAALWLHGKPPGLYTMQDVRSAS